MIEEFRIKTSSRTEMINIDRYVADIVRKSGVGEGVCTVFIPHTTAGITINENADPDVPRDIIAELNKNIPFDDDYRHIEGNSAAHIKASLTGSSATVFVRNGKLLLGTWQSLFFCEFDGPRSRKVVVRIAP
ncbi:MAG: YjbQ family protein [Candidatus Hydrogenedentes bacterium]|nr:YjbQ family protein [Candidatus Hydrogenedentota bacterium]